MVKFHRSFLAALAVLILLAAPLPAAYAQDAAGRQGAAETTDKPWLGISIQDVTPDVALNRPDIQGGVVVSEVKEDSPADKSGIKEGDVIVSLNGQKVSGVDEFVTAIQKQRIGDTVVLGVNRDNTVRDMTVALAAMPGYAMMGMMGGPRMGGHQMAMAGGCPQDCPHCPMMGHGGGMGMTGMGAMCPHEMKGMGRGAGYDKMYLMAMRELKLSPEQKKQVESLRNEYKKRVIKSKADIKIAELELKELARADQVNLDRVKAKINEISTKKADLKFMRYKSLEEFKKVLTPEQRQKVKDMFAMADEGELGEMGHEMEMEEGPGE